MSLYELLDLLASNYQKIDTLWQFFIWVHLALLGGVFVVPRRLSIPERAVGFLAYAGFLYVNRSAMIDSYDYHTVLMDEIAHFKLASDQAGGLLIHQVGDFQLRAKIWFLPWIHLAAAGFVALVLFFADALARQPDPEARTD
jgi:hypothetical protein